jgi:hypothetical protein
VLLIWLNSWLHKEGFNGTKNLEMEMKVNVQKGSSGQMVQFMVW